MSACGSAPARSITADSAAAQPAPAPTACDPAAPCEIPAPAAAQATPTPLLSVKAELSSVEAINGSIVLVEIQVPRQVAAKDFVAKFEDVEHPVFPLGLKKKHGVSRLESVIGIPFTHEPGKAKIELKWKEGEDEKSVELPLEIKEGQYKQEQLTVDPRKVNPFEKDMPRIKREVAQIGEIYNHITPHKYWRGKFSLPVNSKIMSPFGTKRVYNGEMQNYHQGLDLRAPMGTPILAPAPGVVAMAKNLFFTGNTVLLDHGYGIYTIYGHMSRLKVKKGMKLKKGQLIGLAGKTGRATGPHLHWGAVVNKAKVDPLDLTRVIQ